MESLDTLRSLGTVEFDSRTFLRITFSNVNIRNEVLLTLYCFFLKDPARRLSVFALV